MSHSKAFAQCSFSDIALAISVNASASRVFELNTNGDIFPVLRNAALVEAVLLRHPLVRDGSGLKCDGSAWSKRAWCSMLRELFDTGISSVFRVSDAAILRVYLVCKEWAKCGHVQLTPMFEYHDRFLGKVLRVPFVFHLQIVSPLVLIKPALSFARGRAALHQPPSPFGCVQVALWPSQRVRFMFGFAVKACDRASTAPASSHVNFRTVLRWRACMLQHVMAGYVCKVEVRLLLRSSARFLLY
jgi:hypothetical protein